MNSKIPMGLAMSVALVVLIGSCGQMKPSKPTPEPPRIIFKAKLSDDLLARTEKLKVYTLQPSKADRGTFDTQARQLFGGELSGEAVQMNGVISMADTKKASNFMMLELETGYLSFNRGMADQIDDKPDRLPKDDEAVEIAMAFLQKYKLDPGDTKEMKLAHVGHIRSASFDPKTGKQGSVRDQMLTIYFDRQLNGVPIIGSGSRMIVRIGDGGEVVGGARRWKERGRERSIKKKDLRSIGELTKDIETFLSKEMGKAERIEIVQFILVYYDNGGDFIQPALAFEANVIGKDLKYAYLGQTAILRSPPERVGPEPLSGDAKRSLRKSSPDKKPPRNNAD